MGGFPKSRAPQVHLCLFFIVQTPPCSWRVIFIEISIIVLSNFWNAHDEGPTSNQTLIIIVLSLFLERFSVMSRDGQGHLMFTGLMCNVQSFMDRLQATATTLRGEFLFKSPLTLFHPLGADLPPLRANAHTRKKSMGGNSDNF